MWTWAYCQPAKGWKIRMAFSEKGIVKLSIASTQAGFLGELRRAFPLQRGTRNESSTMALIATRQLAE